MMVVIGVGYLGYLFARGRFAIPDRHSIDAVLDHEAASHQP
ncbi:hypothetical protein [Mycolicibacterium hodleri]|nr:hypothetical protein [Mycolicibacterium hodleri]